MMNGIRGLNPPTPPAGAIPQRLKARIPAPPAPPKTDVLMKRFQRKVFSQTAPAPVQSPEPDPSSDDEGSMADSESSTVAEMDPVVVDSKPTIASILRLVKTLILRHEIRAASLLLETWASSPFAAAEPTCSHSDLESQLNEFIGQHRFDMSKSVVDVLHRSKFDRPGVAHRKSSSSIKGPGTRPGAAHRKVSPSTKCPENLPGVAHRKCMSSTEDPGSRRGVDQRKPSSSTEGPEIRVQKAEKPLSTSIAPSLTTAEDARSPSSMRNSKFRFLRMVKGLRGDTDKHTEKHGAPTIERTAPEDRGAVRAAKGVFFPEDFDTLKEKGKQADCSPCRTPREAPYGQIQIIENPVVVDGRNAVLVVPPRSAPDEKEDEEQWLHLPSGWLEPGTDDRRE